MNSLFKIIFFSVISLLAAVDAKAQTVGKSDSGVINQNGHHDAIIWPNPVRIGELVKIKSSTLIKSVEIMNVIGKEIQCEHNDRLIFSDWILNLKIQDAGTYLAKITFDDDKVIVKKFMIR